MPNQTVVVWAHWTMKELKGLENRETLCPCGWVLPTRPFLFPRLHFLTSTSEVTEVLPGLDGLTRSHFWKMEMQGGWEEETSPAWASSTGLYTSPAGGGGGGGATPHPPSQL